MKPNAYSDRERRLIREMLSRPHFPSQMPPVLAECDRLGVELRGVERWHFGHPSDPKFGTVEFIEIGEYRERMKENGAT